MHFDNLLFILLGLAFVVLRWLAQRAGDSKRPPRREQPQPPPRAPAESEEERVRRFMEALGNPVGSKPPPKVTPRPVQQPSATSLEPKRKQLEREMQRPKKSVWTGPLPPLTTTPPAPATPKRVTLPQSTLPVTPATTFEPVKRSAPPASPPRAIAAARGYAAQTQPQPDGIPRPFTELQSLLSSPDGLRNAIILREVLGAPRAFQPLEVF